MVNPTKYDDFKERSRVTKKYHSADVEFVQYKCPLPGCDQLVNVRADEIARLKSTRCLAHLKVCKSTAATTDARVCGKRKERAATPSPEPANKTTRREDELQIRNDALSSQASATRAELDDLKTEMRAFRQSLQEEKEARQKLEQAYEMIARAVGYKTRPLPGPEDIVQAIKGKEKSAALQNALGRSGSNEDRLRAERNHWKRVAEEKQEELNHSRIRHAELDDEAKRRFAMQHEFFGSFKELFADDSSQGPVRAQSLSKLLKKVLPTTHPDKNPDCHEAAEMLTTLILTMRRRLAKVFRL